MNRSTLSWLVSVLVLSTLPAFTVVIAQAVGADKPDLSGSYSLTGAKGDFKVNQGAPWFLRVVQTDIDIEITKIADGKATTNRFKLDGTEAPYTSESGVKGISMGRFKGKALILETEVTVRP